MDRNGVFSGWISVVVLLVAIIVPGLASTAGAVVITPIELNKWYTVTTPASPIDPAAMTPMLKMVTSGCKYVSIYRVTLAHGQKYTFQSEYPADKKDGSICVRGLYPLARSEQYSYPSGTTTLIMCHHRGFPGGNIKGYTFGSKENFIVSAKSKHNYAWLVFYSSKPKVRMKIRMISPAEPDVAIKKSGGYRIRPDGKIKTFWANVYRDHLFLGYASGQKPFAPVSMPQPQPIAALGGGWIDRIKSGQTFQVVFDAVGSKFNDEGYTGDWKTDPMGTLKALESYRVKYSNGRYTVTGYNEQQGRVITHTDAGPNPAEGKIALWGRSYRIDAQGQVYDQKYGLVGHLKPLGGQSPTLSQPSGGSSNLTGKWELLDDQGNKIRVRCDKAFADRVINFQLGDPKPIATVRDPKKALGRPDYNKANDTGYVTLGCGGAITLYFSEVAVVDADGPDIHVFEIGSAAEPTGVQLSKDGKTWHDVGKISGGNGSLDIKGKVKPGDRFKYIRLYDLKSGCGGNWPGADIDAVAAVGCVETSKTQSPAKPVAKPLPKPTLPPPGGVVKLVPAGSYQAQASVPKPLELNKWYDISTPALPFDRAKATGMLKDVAGGYTYIDVFRVKLEIGETYTYQSEYPGDHQYAVVGVRGVNPFSRRKYISNPLGTTFLAVSDDRSFPGGNIKGITFGSRSNFTVSPKSKHSFAFIAIAGYKPNISMKVRMIHPALPNDMIKKEGDYRIKPDGSKSHYGSNVKKTPFWLGRANGAPEQPFEWEVDPKQTSINVAGVWETKWGDMILAQKGAKVTGTYTSDNGEITGYLKGNTFEGFWIEDKSDEWCDDRIYGRHYWGKFRLVFNGNRFSGEFGYCKAPLSKDGWTGVKKGTGSLETESVPKSDASVENIKPDATRDESWRDLPDFEFKPIEE